MQIFYLDNDPKRAAQMLDDKRVNKMLIESMQIISTVWFISNPERAAELRGKDIINMKYNPNHPVIKWTSASILNYIWLYTHALSLVTEYEFRYEKYNHRTKRRLFDLYEETHSKGEYPDLPEIVVPFSEEYQAMKPNELKDTDPVIAYRRYYNEVKYNTCRWEKGRDPPVWFQGYQNNQ
jgi:hypothetical protein